MPAVTSDTLSLPRLKVSVGAQPRAVRKIVTAPSGFEGEGFPVRRAFAGLDPRDVDPFIMMDQMGEVEYAPGEPKGTDWHPHRGFETFSYLLDGQLLHQDSNGGGGTVLEGGTQYMTAGDGILHIETPPEHLVRSGGVFHGIQLWINLPRAKKRLAPQYQDLQGEDTVMVSSGDGGALVRVLAGAVAGHRGPGISHTPLGIAHITISPDARVEIPWERTHNALAYVLNGSGTVGPDGHPFRMGQTAVLTGGDTVMLQADGQQESRSPTMDVFLIGGAPLCEPVFQYGPFVMSTREEVIEAFEDFQSGRFGQIPPHALQPFRV